MKQFKALLRKEWHTNCRILLMPVWFTLGVYAMGLMGLMINMIKGNMLQTAFFTHGYPKGADSIILFTGVAGSVAAVGTIAMITAVILADTLLNGGFKRKCEILHLSHPVSKAKILITKYLFMVVGTIAVLLGVTLVNSLGISTYIGYYTGAHMYFGITAWMQTMVLLFFPTLFAASMYWFFAGMFKRKSFFMGTLVIIGIQAAISILNYTAELHIPSLGAYVLRLLTVQPNLNMVQFMNDMGNFSSVVDAQWSSLITVDSYMRVLYSAIFFVLGSWFYSKRELS